MFERLDLQRLGYLGRPDEAIAAFEAALSRDGENAEVHLAYGETMNRLARPELAIPLLDAVFSKDSYFQLGVPTRTYPGSPGRPRWRA